MVQTFSVFTAQNAEFQKRILRSQLARAPFESGVSGCKNSIAILSSLVSMLAGYGHTDNHASIKRNYDEGMPIVAGTHPESGRFFVATETFEDGKNLCYEQSDITRIYGEDNRLSQILSVAIRYLPNLNISGIVRGTVLFINEDLKALNIQGTECITFQPANRIYAIPQNTDLAGKVKAARIGIVWNWSYVGPHLYDLEVSPNVDLFNMTSTKDVWSKDGDFVDVSGTATFTKDETDKANRLLSEIGMVFASISPRVLGTIAVSETYRKYLRSFINMNLLNASNFLKTVDQFIHYVEADFNSEIAPTKRSDVRLNRIGEKNIIVTFFSKNKAELNKMFRLYSLMIHLQSMIVSKLSQAESTELFINTKNGLKVANDDGYLAIDSFGNVVKLTDKLQFDGSL